MSSGTENAKKIALKLLAQREHSQHELYIKLKHHGIDLLIIEDTLKELGLKGLQSDERFTEIYITSRINRGFGPNNIRQELLRRGINDEIIKKHIGNYPEVEWVELLIKVYHKRFGRNPSSSLKERLKQKKFLYYRGFTQEQINSIL